MDKQQETPKRRPRWAKAFLAALGRKGVVSYACRIARVPRCRAYVLRHADPDFAADWDRELQQALDIMEEEAYRRAIKGCIRKKGVYYRGRKIATETMAEYSDTLLIFLLKGGRPEKFRERFDHTTNLTGSVAVTVIGGVDLASIVGQRQGLPFQGRDSHVTGNGNGQIVTNGQ